MPIKFLNRSGNTLNYYQTIFFCKFKICIIIILIIANKFIFAQSVLSGKMDTVSKSLSKFNIGIGLDLLQNNNYVINSKRGINLAPFDDIYTFQFRLEAGNKIGGLFKNLHWTSTILYSQFGGKFYPNSFDSKNIIYNNLSFGLGLRTNKLRLLFLGIDGIISKSIKVNEYATAVQRDNLFINFNAGINMTKKIELRLFLLKSYLPHFQINNISSFSKEYWNIYGFGVFHKFK